MIPVPDAQPSHPGALLIISGPSGAGKTTIARSVADGIDRAVLSLSTTTRPMGAGDREGVDYHFLDTETFIELEAQNAFLETAVVFQNRYGTPRAWVEEKLAQGHLVVLEIDVQGAIRVKEQMPQAYGLFVMPPSEEALLERLRARKREDESIIQRRFAEAKHEIATAQACDVYDIFVTNDVLQTAIAESTAYANGLLQPSL